MPELLLESDSQTNRSIILHVLKEQKLRADTNMKVRDFWRLLNTADTEKMVLPVEVADSERVVVDGAVRGAVDE